MTLVPVLYLNKSLNYIQVLHQLGNLQLRSKPFKLLGVPCLMDHIDLSRYRTITLLQNKMIIHYASIQLPGNIKKGGLKLMVSSMDIKKVKHRITFVVQAVAFEALCQLIGAACIFMFREYSRRYLHTCQNWLPMVH